MKYYFRQFWNDPRLAYGKDLDTDTIMFGSEISDKIWLPDTFMVNEKSGVYHKVPADNDLVRISRNGDILRSIR